jgi:hypothetical protein
LSARLVEKGLYDQYIASSRAASEKKFITDPHLLFATKFPGYARMPFEKKRKAAALWIFREYLGERFDCPVGYILPRKLLAAIMSGDDRDMVAAIDKVINSYRKPHKRLAIGMIREYYERAMRSPHIPEKSSVKRRQLGQGQGQGQGGA